MRRLDLGIYENIIEVSWMFKDLIAAGKIKSWDDLMDELPTGSDAIKETIMQIAEDFEKEYNIDDWNETDMQYLEEIIKYSEKRLVEEYGREKSAIKVGDTVKVITSTTSHWDAEKKTEYIPIGTICKIRDIDYCKDETYYGIQPLESNEIFYYLEDELEKGHMEWIKDE